MAPWGTRAPVVQSRHTVTAAEPTWHSLGSVAGTEGIGVGVGVLKYHPPPPPVGSRYASDGGGGLVRHRHVLRYGHRQKPSHGVRGIAFHPMDGKFTSHGK